MPGLRPLPVQATYAKPDLLKVALVMGSSYLGLLRLENTGPMSPSSARRRWRSMLEAPVTR